MNEDIDLERIPIIEGALLDKKKIKERLKIMEVNFNPSVYGKKYFSDLYDSAIQDIKKRDKIKSMLVDDIKEKEVVKRQNKDAEIKNKMIGDSKYDKISKDDTNTNEGEELTFNHYFGFNNGRNFNRNYSENENYNKESNSLGKDTNDSNLKKSLNIGQEGLNDKDNKQNKEMEFQEKRNNDNDNRSDIGHFKINVDDDKLNNNIGNDNNIGISQHYKENYMKEADLFSGKVDDDKETNSQHEELINNNKNDMPHIEKEEKQLFTKLPQSNNQINSFTIPHNSFPLHSSSHEHFIHNNPIIPTETKNPSFKPTQETNLFISNSPNHPSFYINQPTTPPKPKNRLLYHLILPLLYLILFWLFIITLIHLFNDPTDFQTTLINITSSFQLSSEKLIILTSIAVLFLIINYILNKRNSS